MFGALYMYISDWDVTNNMWQINRTGLLILQNLHQLTLSSQILQLVDIPNFHPTNYSDCLFCKEIHQPLSFYSMCQNQYQDRQTCVQFMSYSKCSNLLSNFGCLFTFCYLKGANSIKTDLHVCNLLIGQFVGYNSVI